MGQIGFDNDKYLAMQSAHIRERISKFGGKLYLEFGGKLFDDFHASRVLPGFQPDSKIRMLQQLRDDAEIVIAVNANDIEKNKVRGDLGITYDDDCLRLIDAFRSLGLYVGGQALLAFLLARGFSFAAVLEPILRNLHLYSFVLLTALFSTVFLALPNRRQRVFHVLPGAAAAAGAWVLFSEGYSFYVNHIAKASALYGSLSVLLLMLLWLYACISILFYGALFNCMLFDWKRPEETKPCSDT